MPNTEITQPEIRLVDGQAITTSREIASTFGRLHKDVIRKIDSLECSTEFTERNFTLSEYTDSTGRSCPCYNITRDGFTFLAMGFTGKKAAAFKEAYINAFNQMEKQLNAQQSTLPVSGTQRLLLVIEDGKIVSCRDIKNKSLVRTDGLMKLRQNLQLVTKQLLWLQGEQGHQVLDQEPVEIDLG